MFITIKNNQQPTTPDFCLYIKFLDEYETRATYMVAFPAITGK